MRILITKWKISLLISDNYKIHYSQNLIKIKKKIHKNNNKFKINSRKFLMPLKIYPVNYLINDDLSEKNFFFFIIQQFYFK